MKTCGCTLKKGGGGDEPQRCQCPIEKKFEEEIGKIGIIFILFFSVEIEKKEINISNAILY